METARIQSWCFVGPLDPHAAFKLVFLLTGI